MKNLFAAASYSFNNFYGNLNTQGQMVFSAIIFLIVILCILLFFTYVFQDIKNKARIRHIAKQNKKVIEQKKEELVVEQEIKQEEVQEEKNEIENIASAISTAIENEITPISLTDFEEDQEKTAIISINELIQKAKELEIVDDDNGNVNFLEKYNLEPAEIAMPEQTMNEQPKEEVKAFKVSQVISPIYGVKKEVIDKNENI